MLRYQSRTLVQFTRRAVLHASLFVLVLALLVTPVLAAPSTFSWATYSWATPGALSQTYTGVGSPTRDITFTFSGDTGFLETNRPATNAIITGGFPTQNNLFWSVNFDNTDRSVLLTITFNDYVRDVSFTVMDVDINYNPGDPTQVDSQDEIVVTGNHAINGSVTPTLTATNPACVSISGNVATAQCNIDNDQSGGNVLVEFNQAITSVTILYREGPLSPTDPQGHGIALHDINFTPSTPTAVSLQALSATTSMAANYALAGGFILTFVTLTVLYRRRQQRPLPVRE